MTLGQEPACCDVIQQRVPAVSFQNAQAPLNCIVSPKTFGLQSMKAEESARKNVFSYGCFSRFFGRFAMRGVPQKAPGDVPGQPWGVGWPGGAIFAHFWSPFWTHFGTLGVQVAPPGAPAASPWPPFAPLWWPPGAQMVPKVVKSVDLLILRK